MTTIRLAPRSIAFFRVGFAAQISLVLLIGTGAYLGYLPTQLPSFPHVDLFGHAVLIGLLAFFFDGALRFRPLVRGLEFPRLGSALVLVAAAIEEYAQRFSTRRHPSISDYAADVVGVLALSWLSKRLSTKMA